MQYSIACLGVKCGIVRAGKEKCENGVSYSEQGAGAGRICRSGSDNNGVMTIGVRRSMCIARAVWVTAAVVTLLTSCANPRIAAGKGQPRSRPTSTVAARPTDRPTPRRTATGDPGILPLPVRNTTLNGFAHAQPPTPAIVPVPPAAGPPPPTSAVPPIPPGSIRHWSSATPLP